MFHIRASSILARNAADMKGILLYAKPFSPRKKQISRQVLCENVCPRLPDLPQPSVDRTQASPCRALRKPCSLPLFKVELCNDAAFLTSSVVSSQAIQTSGKSNRYLRPTTIVHLIAVCHFTSTLREIFSRVSFFI